MSDQDSRRPVARSDHLLRTGIASLFFGFTAPATSATAATPDRKTTDVTSTVAESRCPVCTKRIGKRPSMRCDDCGVFVHVK